ncbi:MAG TPA: hypothetical protein VM778_05310, partial [Gemmatimonadota bacterium]|nr:hypothetical protein [Gemmatimonadota bacterium]
ATASASGMPGIRRTTASSGSESPAAREAAAREAWPAAPIERIESDELANRVIVSIEGPAPPRVDLFFPVPRETVVARGGMGPFLWRSGDRKGLEIPGLLGVTTGAPEPAAQRDFLLRLGLREMEPGGPLAVGDHQWVLEERDPPGIYGWAATVSDAKVKDLARTMGHLGADHRLDGNRLVAADPAGRVILVHGVRSA